ncbi:MAG: FAD-binding oxidoreductase [Alphaproteobacteria bacterium]|nr:FAD-binding oxidoreductase [Alphaproteobacteria bacterium]
MTVADAVIIGGGIQGCSAALHLARLGAKAVVLEMAHAGRHASGVNAGGVRTLGRHMAEVPLAVAALEAWHRIGDLVDDDCGFESVGQVMVAETDAELTRMRSRAEDLSHAGFLHEEPIDSADLRRLVPAVADHCVGGLVARRDGAANPFRATLAFKRKAESLGARVREGVRALGIERVPGGWEVDTDDGRIAAPAVINAAGAWADRFAAQMGDPVPLQAIAPMLMVTAPMPRFVEPVVIGGGRTLSFKQFRNGTVLVGGGHRGRADRASQRTVLDWRELSVNAESACALFPIMRTARVVRAWAGIEGRMPDDIPVIGPSGRQDGAFHAFGFSAHGFQLAPIVGAVIADLVTSGRSRLPIEPFRIGRFRAAAG